MGRKSLNAQNVYFIQIATPPSVWDNFLKLYSKLLEEIAQGVMKPDFWTFLNETSSGNFMLKKSELGIQIFV